jgi:hypothetical protein
VPWLKKDCPSASPIYRVVKIRFAADAYDRSPECGNSRPYGIGGVKRTDYRSVTFCRDHDEQGASLALTKAGGSRSLR